MNADILKMLEDMKLEMKAMREENQEVRNELKALSGSKGEKSASDSAQSERNEVDASGVKNVNTPSDGGKYDESKQLPVAATGGSLISGMPVYHGIGSGMLTTAEEILFEKWHRRVEKSLTGSKVKVFHGVAYITWRQMILRDVILNDLNDTLLKPTTTPEVAALPPFHRNFFCYRRHSVVCIS
jgi:hypothetical protein